MGVHGDLLALANDDHDRFSGLPNWFEVHWFGETSMGGGRGGAEGIAELACFFCSPLLWELWELSSVNLPSSLLAHVATVV